MGEIVGMVLLAIAWSVFISLVAAAMIFFIFSIIGIPALAALSFWQVYGGALALNIATKHF